MNMFGKWILGSITIFFAKLHYRYEVIPYAKKKGHSVEDVQGAAALAVHKLIRNEWQ